MLQTVLGSMSGAWLTVEDPQAARLLTDPDSRRFLEPFIGRERTAGEAARELGVSVKRLLYRLRALLAAGLLVQSGVQARAGRAMKRYRASAEGFVVPFALTPYDDLEALLRRQTAPHERLLTRAWAHQLSERGLTARLIYRDDRGELQTETALPPGTTWADLRGGQAGSDFSGVHWLSDEQAREVNDLFEALRQRLQAAPSPERPGRPYLISVALAPLRPGDLEGE